MRYTLPNLFLLFYFALLFCACSADQEQGEEVARTTSDQHQTSAVSFTNVTANAGLDKFRHKTGASGKKWLPETMGAGCGVIDYNSDGWPDLLLVGGGVWSRDSDQQIPALRLYRNNEDGTFSEVTTQAGLDGIHAYGMGVTVADYDNDGDEDFYFTTLNKNMLFRNDSGAFVRVGELAGVRGGDEWSSSALFFDADRDGHLDLYVGNYLEWSPETDVRCTLKDGENSYCAPDVYDSLQPRFYHNDGDGTFTEMTAAAGLKESPGKTLGVATLDFNRDNWPDLVVANDLKRNLLYRNNGGGTFEEIGMRSGIAFSEQGEARGGMGIDTGAITGDSAVSIVVGNYSREKAGVFRHGGRGLFDDRSALSKIGKPSLPTLTFGLFLFDPDLDGDLDLFAANGHLRVKIGEQRDGITYRQSPQLYLNDGSGQFEEIGKRVGGPFQQRFVARGAARGDYDRDGDEDILITENGGPASLWRNDVSDETFLRVRLKGSPSNRQGIGSRIEVVADSSRLRRRIRTGSSYLSHSDPAATFGLPSTSTVDSLIVRWPSGHVDRFVDVDVNQEIVITEGSKQFAMR